MADYPSVTKRGTLSKPYPIRTRGDFSRSRVLPPPEPDSGMGEMRTAPKSPKAPAAPKAPAGDRSLDQPKGGFDYIRKRNTTLNRSLSGRR